jgi:uncharacterized protein with ParB-like and HNH nuclease domain
MSYSDEILPPTDVDLEKIESEELDAASSPPQFEISTYPADYTLEVYWQKWKSNEILIPVFQRGFVWKISQSSRLVESFMMGLPVPQIFLYTDEQQKYLVIDGQQRLKSIFYFFEGYFGQPDKANKRSIFKLHGLDEKSKWSGLKFEDFEPADQRKLRQSVLRAIVVKQLNPDDNTSVFHIFERLNTGGTLLKPQEVRNAVYSGTLNDLLLELNIYPQWRELLHKPLPDSRQKDVELILRYMSLYHWGEKYYKPMKTFMSDFMSRNRNPSMKIIEEERQRFRTTCDTITQKLPVTPFSPLGPLNAAVFDAIFIAFSKNLDKLPADIGQRYVALMNDIRFETRTRASTADPETVRTRLEIAERTLFA